MTRDELLAWLLLPWNIVKAIGLTAWWIIAALVRGDDDETPIPAPRSQSAQRRRRAGRGADAASATTVPSVDSPGP